VLKDAGDLVGAEYVTWQGVAAGPSCNCRPILFHRTPKNLDHLTHQRGTEGMTLAVDVRSRQDEHPGMSSRSAGAVAVMTLGLLSVPDAVNGTIPSGRTTSRVSVSSSGVPANDESLQPSISARGRYLTWTSFATNLAGGDSTGAYDIFRRDRLTRRTELVSVSSRGEPADGHSSQSSVSGDGQRIAFTSSARDLVTGDTNSASDIFVRDMARRTTVRASIDSRERQARPGNDGSLLSQRPVLSAGGRFVAFESSATNLVARDTNGAGARNGTDVFVRNLAAGITVRASVGPRGRQANGASRNAAISADGRYVAFSSVAANLVPGDTNRRRDAFVRDLRRGTTERVSVGPLGRQAAGGDGSLGTVSISGDGRYVAFLATATNLVPGDTNRSADVFVHDRRTHRTERVSVGAHGQGNRDSNVSAAAISANGRYVTFVSDATNLLHRSASGTHAYVRDRQTASTRRASVPLRRTPGGTSSTESVVSSDGAHVAFAARTAELVPGPGHGLQIYARDDFLD
jgi:Tol biopolymer transport system component